MCRLSARSRPTFVLFAPRVWEAIAADVRARMMDASPLKQAPLCARHEGAASRRSPRASGRWWPRSLLFRALRDRLGFTRLRSAATGGAALGPTRSGSSAPSACRCASSTARPKRSAPTRCTRPTTSISIPSGVAIRATASRSHRGARRQRRRRDRRPPSQHVPRLLTATRPPPPPTCATAGCSPAMPAISTTTGSCVIIDRIRDLAQTARGDRFSPQYIENKLKFSPYVAEAVVLGRRPRHPGGDDLHPLLDRLEMGRGRAASLHHLHRSPSRPEVYDLIAGEVEAVNATLPPAQRIAKFLLLYKELDADDGELTRTRKVRRSVIEREVRRHHRCDLRRRQRAIPRRYRDPLPGWHDAAHPHDAARGRAGAPRGDERRIPDPAFLINGLIVGTLYGVVAMSFVLIYKATQVVNFAQGELLLVGAWVCWALLTSTSCRSMSACRLRSSSCWSSAWRCRS